MQLEITDEEARLLALHLERHIKRVDDELVHTDSRQMQRDLANDERRLLAILEKLEIGLGQMTLPLDTEPTWPRNAQ
jgi:hypothetical protein